MIVRSNKNVFKRGEILHHSKFGYLCVLSMVKRPDHFEYEACPVEIVESPGAAELELTKTRKIVDDLRRDLKRLQEEKAREAATPPPLWKRIIGRR